MLDIMYVLAKLESYQPTKVDVHSFTGFCKTLKNLILKRSLFILVPKVQFVEQTTNFRQILLKDNLSTLSKFLSECI